MCLGSNIPTPPPPPPPPQAAKAPDTTPLKRRNGSNSGGVAIPAGSTMLTGTTGVTNAQLNLGSSSLLGGGTPPSGG